MLTAQIAAIADALGCLVRFVILRGPAQDLPQNLPFRILIGGKAFGAGRLLEEINGRSAMPMIPLSTNRPEPRDHGREMRKRKPWIKKLFSRKQEFWAVAVDYAKTDASFAGAIHLVTGGGAAN